MTTLPALRFIRRIMRKQLTLAISIAALFTGSLSANEENSVLQEFIFNNGDKLSGVLVSADEQNVVIQHPTLGNLEIPRNSLVSIPGVDTTPSEAAPTTGVLPGTLTATTEVDAPLIPQKEVLPFWHVPENWDGKFSVGTSWQSGRSKKSSVDLRAELTVKKEVSEFQYTGFYRYEKTNSNVSSDRWGLGFRYRYDLGPNRFIQATTSYESDRIKKMDNHLLQTLGYGFRLVDSETFHINLVPGIAVEYIDQRGTKSNTNFLLNIYQDMHWEINERFALKQSFNFFINPSETDEHRFLFKSGIIGSITETIKMDISYEYEYDNSVVRPISKGDSRLISAIVLAF